MPPRPALAAIESSRLDSLDDDTFWSLMDRERRIVDWAVEMQVMLKEVCGG